MCDCLFILSFHLIPPTNSIIYTTGKKIKIKQKHYIHYCIFASKKNMSMKKSKSFKRDRCGSGSEFFGEGSVSNFFFFFKSWIWIQLFWSLGSESSLSGRSDPKLSLFLLMNLILIFNIFYFFIMISKVVKKLHYFMKKLKVE